MDFPTQMYQSPSRARCQPPPPTINRTGWEQQQQRRKDPHAPVKREGEVQAEGPFDPLEAGGQGHLQKDDGEGSDRKTAAEVIGELILGVQVNQGFRDHRRENQDQVDDEAGGGCPTGEHESSILRGIFP